MLINKGVIKRSFKIGIVLIMATIVFDCASIWIPSLEGLIPSQMWNKLTFVFIVLLLTPSFLFGLNISKNLLPETILGWILGILFLFIIIFIICLLLSLLIEMLKHANKTIRQSRH